MSRTKLYASRAIEELRGCIHPPANPLDSNRTIELEGYRRGLQWVRLCARSMGLPVPTREELNRSIDGRNKVAANRRGEFSSLAKPRNNEGELFQFWLSWHRGGGSLWGPMMRAHDPLSDRMDSVVQVYRRLLGLESNALNAWIETGTVGQGGAR